MKHVFSLAFVAFPLIGFGQNYTIKGQIGQYNAPARVYLSYKLNGEDKIDSAAVKNGAFQFTGTITEPVRADLNLNVDGTGPDESYDILPIYIDKGTTLITGKDSATTAVVTGTAISQDFADYKKAFIPVNNELNAIKDRYYDVDPEEQETVAFKRSMDSLNQIAAEHYQTVFKRFLDAHPNSYVSLDALINYTLTANVLDAKELVPLFARLSADMQHTTAGKKYNDMLTKLNSTEVGQVAPDFTQADTAGKPVALSSFRGKYVLLDFWASWCGPCRAENPNVVKLYNQYKDKNFTVLSVSLDRENAKDQWLQAIHKDGLTWTNVSDLRYFENAAAMLYFIQSIPQNYLLDPQGKIIGKNLRGEELQKKLAEIL